MSRQALARLEEFIPSLNLDVQAEQELREIIQLTLLEGCLNCCKYSKRRRRSTPLELVAAN
jgi:hypothetical protein